MVFHFFAMYFTTLSLDWACCVCTRQFVQTLWWCWICVKYAVGTKQGSKNIVLVVIVPFPQFFLNFITFMLLW